MLRDRGEVWSGKRLGSWLGWLSLPSRAAESTAGFGSRLPVPEHRREQSKRFDSAEDRTGPLVWCLRGPFTSVVHPKWPIGSPGGWSKLGLS
jgi:hypothetical protein